MEGGPVLGGVMPFWGSPAVRRDWLLTKIQGVDQPLPTSVDLALAEHFTRAAVDRFTCPLRVAIRTSSAFSPTCLPSSSALAPASNKCVLAYSHHPLFSSGHHGGDKGVRPLFQAPRTPAFIDAERSIELINAPHKQGGTALHELVEFAERLHEVVAVLRNVDQRAGGTEWVDAQVPPRVALDAVAGEVFQVAFAVEMHAVDAQFMPSAEQIVDERALSHAALPRDEDVSIYLFSRQPEGLTAVRLSEKELSVKRGFTATIVSFLTSTPLSCSGYLLLRIVPDNLHAVADWESEVRVIHRAVSRH